MVNLAVNFLTMSKSYKSASEKAYDRGRSDGSKATFADGIMESFSRPITNILDSILPDSPSQKAYKGGYKDGLSNRNSKK